MTNPKGLYSNSIYGNVRYIGNDGELCYYYTKDNDTVRKLSLHRKVQIKDRDGVWITYKKGVELFDEDSIVEEVFFDHHGILSSTPNHDNEVNLDEVDLDSDESDDENLNDEYKNKPDLAEKNVIEDVSISDGKIIKRLEESGFHRPSSEQLRIIKSAVKGKDIKVNAFAGTGKTTTIKMIAECVQKKATYLAFNRAAVDEVKGKLPLVEAKTAHEIAYHEVVGSSVGFKEKFEDSEKTWFHNTVLKYLGKDFDKKDLPPIIRTVKRFVKTADSTIGVSHISNNCLVAIQKRHKSNSEKMIERLCYIAESLRQQEGGRKITGQTIGIEKGGAKESVEIDALLESLFPNGQLIELIRTIVKNANDYSLKDPISEQDFPSKQYNLIKELDSGDPKFKIELSINKIIARANELWSLIINENSMMPIDYDCYLKLWQLKEPEIDTPLIYIDEAQDLDPVMLSVIKRQNAQKIWLGDKYQQIYAWRGAVNALDEVNDCEEFALTETYRFPPYIAGLANKVLNKMGERKSIKTHVGESRAETQKQAYIARYNNTLFKQALSLAESKDKFYLKGFDALKLKSHCGAVIDIYCGRTPTLDIYKEFSSIDELKSYLEEENNDKMRRALSLCEMSKYEMYSVKRKLETINSFNTKLANKILITAHQSKGLEWDDVVISSDFKHAIEKESKSKDKTCHEWNLFYVAVTRAKAKLSLLSQILNFVIPNRKGKQDLLSKENTVAEYDKLKVENYFYDESSKALYKQIKAAGYLLPEVGYEQVNHRNEVIGEIELAWVSKKIGLYLEPPEERLDGWKLFSVDEVSSDFSLLDNFELLDADCND